MGKYVLAYQGASMAEGEAEQPDRCRKGKGPTKLRGQFRKSLGTKTLCLTCSVSSAAAR